jgi:hypothetical protein
MFDPERDSEIYPHLSPEDHARYRAMAERHLRALEQYSHGDPLFAGDDRFLTVDEMWRLQQEHRKAMEYFRSHSRAASQSDGDT